VCSLQPDDLAANLKNASAFNARFKILKTEYALRAACASKLEQSLRDVVLPDMTRIEDRRMNARERRTGAPDWRAEKTERRKGPRRTND